MVSRRTTCFFIFVKFGALEFSELNWAFIAQQRSVISELLFPAVAVSLYLLRSMTCNCDKCVSLGVVLVVLLIAFKPINVDAGKMPIGINVGLTGDNLPDVSRTVELLGNLHAGAVRLYDANPEMLYALSFRPIDVIVSVRNDQLPDIATSLDAADGWVQGCVTPFYPATKITFIAVGNEVLHERNVDSFGPYFIQAMRNINEALVIRNLHHDIKIISPLSGEILGSSWPPANAFFDRLDYVIPLLHFLQNTGSTFFINLYPYYAYIADNTAVPLDFASFERTSPAFVDSISNKPYSNLFEAMLDAAYNAMGNLGFLDLPLAVGETGWPTAGCHAATIRNAELFNGNLVEHVYRKGTPQRPDVRIRVFIFALFNENQKPGPAHEHHWGLLNADGSPVYAIDLADPGEVLDASSLPSSTAAASVYGTSAIPMDSVEPTPVQLDALPPSAAHAAGTSENPIEFTDDPAEVLDAPTLPLLVPAIPTAPTDGTAVTSIHLGDPSAVLDAPTLPYTATDGAAVDSIDLANPSVVLEPPTLPYTATDGAAVDSIDLANPSVVLEAPNLPYTSRAPTDGAAVDSIDLANPSLVLDAPTLPYTATAPTDSTAVDSIDLANPSGVLDAPTLPYTATAPTNGTVVDSIDWAHPSVGLDAPIVPYTATAPTENASAAEDLADLAEPTAVLDPPSPSLPAAQLPGVLRPTQQIRGP